MTGQKIKIWRVIVWGVAPHQAGLMVRLKFLPAKDKPTTFWREYPTRPQVEAVIAQLGAAGLHGVAKLGERTAKKPRPRPKLSLVPSREGFGGKLNAKPISSSWRVRPRRK